MSVKGNLQRIKGSFVYSPLQTNLRALEGHEISFSFPYSLTKELTCPKTVILTGVIKNIIFAAGNQVELEKKSFKLNTLEFDGVSFSSPAELQKVHQKGELALKNASQMKTQILGTRNTSPCYLVATEYEVLLNLYQTFPDHDQVVDDLDFLQEVVEKINSFGSRSLVVSQEKGSPCTITIPAEWVIQNLTALEKLAKKGKPAPIIEIPVAFPALGSKIFHSLRGLKGEVCDFRISIDNDIWIKCKVPETRTSFECVYSKLFATTPKELRDPTITRILTPEDRLSLKEVNSHHQVPRYLHRSREFILQYMSLWKPVLFPENYSLQMLCMVPSDEDPQTLRPVWRTPQKALSDYHKGEEIRFTSMVDCEYTDDQENGYSSCVSNAVNGDLYLRGNHRRQEVFFTTKNCRGLSLVSDPPFKPYEIKEPATVDIINPPRMLGYSKLNEIERDDHRKYVVMWTPVSEAFYNLYLWIVTRSSNTIFRGLSSRQLREMFYDEEQPELVEIYEFMARGVNPEMKDPSRYPWVNWFVKEILMCDFDDLLD